MLAMKEQYPTLRNGRPLRDKDMADIASIRRLAPNDRLRRPEPARLWTDHRQTGLLNRLAPHDGAHPHRVFRLERGLRDPLAIRSRREAFAERSHSASTAITVFDCDQASPETRTRRP